MTLNFPSSPADQQEYNGYIYDATKGVWNRKATTTDNVAEGSTNLYFTNQRAIDAVGENLALTDLSDVDTYDVVDGQVIVYNAAGDSWEPGTLTLDSLSDTDISGVADGEALVYDSNTSTWVPVNITVNSIDDVSDVTITTPADGQVLTYNSGTWENQNIVIPESYPHPFTMLG